MTENNKQPGNAPEKSFNAGDVFKGEANKPSVIILSGACCNAMLAASDQKLKEKIEEVLKDLNVQSEIHTLDLLGVQSKKEAISKLYPDLVKDVIDIFQRNGFLGFPALIVNGEILHFGEVPGVDVIKEKITGVI